MKAVGNQMMHVRIIQRLLKKLVQLRQKIDIPQLRTKKKPSYCYHTDRRLIRQNLEYLCRQSLNIRVIL